MTEGRLTFDETEALYAVLIRHGDFQEDDCDGHEEFDCRSDVYAAVGRIVTDRMESAASALDDLALTLVTTSDDNPEGNSLTAAVIQKCAEIVRQATR